MVVVPVQSTPKERSLIEMFLSAYENDTWKTASLDWVEETEDAAVEVVATRADGVTLALEHTLIQPFVDEKFDSEKFKRAFGRIDKNPALLLPGRVLYVGIPVHAVPKGYDWGEVGEGLFSWLVANHTSAPKNGITTYTIPVGHTPKKGPLQLTITLRTGSLPGTAGDCLTYRTNVPEDLGAIVEKALITKVPKLVKTPTKRHILLFECEQGALAESKVYGEIVKLAPKFPDIGEIDELWFANTSALASERWAFLELIDGRGVVEVLTFQNGVLKERRDDRPCLGPARREF